LRIEIAIPERRLLIGFGFFRENALSKWTLAAIEARHGPAIGSKASDAAPIGQHLQTVGLSVAQHVGSAALAGVIDRCRVHWIVRKQADVT
jgi:hypothetical protein